MPADPLIRPAALLWDFDGTTVNSEDSWQRAELGMLAELGGVQPGRELVDLVGMALVDSARAILDAAARDDLNPHVMAEELNDRALADLAEHGAPMRPGVAALLAEAREAGIPCALVSASFERVLRSVLEGWEDRPFDVVIGGDMVARGKPDPEPYLSAAEALGVDPADCLVIEDSVAGATSAIAAGCVVLGVPFRQSLDAVAGIARRETLAGVRLDELIEVYSEGRHARV